MRDWRARNRASYDEYMREYHRHNAPLLRQLVFDRYGGAVCVCCGEQTFEFLGIDHVDGGGSKHRASIPSGNLYRWLKQNNFPDGYQVLCHNCNLAKGFYKRCPHVLSEKN
jgi:hypothetical protein